MKTKLIIVEGIPGTGKSLTASFIKELLDKNHIQSILYQEGNLDHPADYESVACLDDAEYDNLLLKYNKNRDLLSKNVIKKGNDYFFCYRKMKQDSNTNLSDELFKALSKYDVYDLSLEKYNKICKARWKEFVKSSKSNHLLSIFECCFLQNPLSTMLARHNADQSYINQYIMDLTEIINDLNPVLIFLYQDSVKKTFEKVIPERPKEWLDFVIGYVTQQEYGKVHQLEGFEGLVKFYEALRTLEVDIFKTLPFKKLFIDNSGLNWDKCHQDIEIFLKEAL
jgi:hypothetical protein